MFVLINIFDKMRIFSFSSMELVRRPSYTTRYRTVRNRYPNEGSPQRRTTVVRRAPASIITEGNLTQ